MKITVEYSCNLCGIHRRPVEVPERNPDMVVTDWLQRIVIVIIAGDHQAMSPGCMADEISDLRIPYAPDADYIGQPTKQ